MSIPYPIAAFIKQQLCISIPFIPMNSILRQGMPTYSIIMAGMPYMATYSTIDAGHAKLSHIFTYKPRHRGHFLRLLPMPPCGPTYSIIKRRATLQVCAFNYKGKAYYT